jgi:hypothetical protein
MDAKDMTATQLLDVSVAWESERSALWARGAARCRLHGRLRDCVAAKARAESAAAEGRRRGPRPRPDQITSELLSAEFRFEVKPTTTGFAAVADGP